MPKGKHSLSHCPIYYAMSSFGDKWSLLIIRDLMFFGKRCYSEFLHSDEAISTNILANRLSQLERDGIITKSSDPENRTKYLYALTQKGLDLIPVMLELVNWGAMYDKDMAVPPGFIEEFQKDKTKLQEKVLANYKTGGSILD